VLVSAVRPPRLPPLERRWVALLGCARRVSGKHPPCFQVRDAYCRPVT
jgi:hypothetical protein